MSFTTTEPAGIIGYPLKQTQTEFISSAGTPGTPETPITGDRILSGTTAETSQFTAPNSIRPIITSTAVRASRTTTDKIAVVTIAQDL